MYKHQKYFDITKFIKEIVDIGETGLINRTERVSRKEYRAKADELFEHMPREFQKRYRMQYAAFINDYEKERIKTKEFHVWSITKLLEALGIIDDRYKTTGNTINKRELEKNISVTQHGSSTIIKFKDMDRKKIIKGQLGVFLPAENTIFAPESVDKKSIDHEYQHSLNAKMIPDRHTKNIEKIKEPTKLQEDIDYKIKDEFLAQIKGKSTLADAMGELMVKYIPSYLFDLGFTDNKIAINIIPDSEDEAHIEILSKEGDYINKLDDKIIEIVGKKIALVQSMGLIYERLKEICIPEYYPDDQFVYLLAITPLSRRGDLLKTYESIDTLKKNKGDLYNLLSIKND